MSFRIDAVQRRAQSDGECWVWDVKGIYGQGIHSTLLTGAGRRGFYLFKWPDHPNDNPRIPLCPEEEFQVVLDTPPAKAARMLAATLTRLGWGPEKIRPAGSSRMMADRREHEERILNDHPVFAHERRRVQKGINHELPPL